MRNSYILLAAAMFLALFLWQRRPADLVPAQNSSGPKAKLEKKTSPSSPKVNVAPEVQPVSESSAVEPPEHSAHFRVVEDWVIGYGDLLLGKPSAPDFPNEGYTHPPTWAKWPKGVIPFAFHVDLPNPDRVLRVVEYINSHTRLKLVPYESGEDSIIFTPFRDHCLSYLGKIGGHQPIFLDDRCSDSEITHEVLHAAGFVHEHSRPDRDRYVKVVWDNVQDEKRDQFEVVPEELAKFISTHPFDYKSIMIYQPTAFAKDRGSVTLQSLTDEKIEPAETGMSAEDIRRVNQLYGN